MLVTKTELRYLYNQKMLVEALVEHSFIMDGWIVEFRHQRGGLVPLTDASGIEKTFADPDTATTYAMEVGFSQVRVVDE